jgi:hypothetical protein
MTHTIHSINCWNLGKIIDSHPTTRPRFTENSSANSTTPFSSCFTFFCPYGLSLRVSSDSELISEGMHHLETIWRSIGHFQGLYLHSTAHAKIMWTHIQSPKWSPNPEFQYLGGRGLLTAAIFYFVCSVEEDTHIVIMQIFITKLSSVDWLV